MNNTLQQLNDLLDEFAFEDNSPSVSVPRAQVSPEQSNPLVVQQALQYPKVEEDPALKFRRRKQFKYLKKFINNPYNDSQSKGKTTEPRDYFWNINPSQYYGK